MISLTVRDRVLFNAILPQQGKMIEMIVCRSIIEAVQFSLEDIKEFELIDCEIEQKTKWNPLKEREVQVNFTQEQLSLLKKSISNLDDSGAITIQLLPLCEKIMDL